ncbi:MAG: deoxyribose-phosphate aldolase [Clostridia bacterium]|nr:deoxyribose-phosphate aldolase [Clostridia bacterium]
MTQKEILSHVDHTLLGVDATWADIKGIIDDGIRYETASVCIPPRFVKPAAEYAAGRVKICTVIGFPNGYNSTAAKVFETKDAVENGADEIDMVIPVGAVKSGEYELVEEEIRAVKAACGGKTLKVIIETYLLTDDEKRRLCRVVSDAGADYIKTSTGFQKGGATFADIALMREASPDTLKIKAAGGISSFADAERFLELGADRLGTSRLVKILKSEDSGNGY